MLRDAGINARVIHMDPYKDPDEFIKALGNEEFEKRINDAQNAFLFEIEVLRKDYDITDPEQKTKFDHEMARKLLVFEDKVQRDNYIETLSAKYSIKKEDLRGLVIKMRIWLQAGQRKHLVRVMNIRKTAGNLRKKE